jgi:large subunit ribosomal protein L21
MAYAIIRSGGKQFRADEGATLRLPSITKDVGESVELEALIVAAGDDIKVGADAIGGAAVKATVVSHGRGDKIIVFKKKRRKTYKRRQGHRQGFTTVKIDSIG